MDKPYVVTSGITGLGLVVRVAARWDNGLTVLEWAAASGLFCSTVTCALYAVFPALADIPRSIPVKVDESLPMSLEQLQLRTNATRTHSAT